MNKSKKDFKKNLIEDKEDNGGCRKDDSLSTGHICSSTTTLLNPGQSNVFVNGRLMARKTDSTVPHPFPPSPP